MPTFDRAEMKRVADMEDEEFAQEICDNLERALKDPHALSAGRWYGKASAYYARINDGQRANRTYTLLRAAWEALALKHNFPTE